LLDGGSGMPSTIRKSHTAARAPDIDCSTAHTPRRGAAACVDGDSAEDATEALPDLGSPLLSPFSALPQFLQPGSGAKQSSDGDARHAADRDCHASVARNLSVEMANSSATADIAAAAAAASVPAHAGQLAEAAGLSPALRRNRLVRAQQQAQRTADESCTSISALSLLQSLPSDSMLQPAGCAAGVAVTPAKPRRTPAAGHHVTFAVAASPPTDGSRAPAFSPGLTPIAARASPAAAAKPSPWFDSPGAAVHVSPPTAAPAEINGTASTVTASGSTRIHASDVRAASPGPSRFSYSGASSHYTSASYLSASGSRGHACANVLSALRDAEESGVADVSARWDFANLMVHGRLPASPLPAALAATTGTASAVDVAGLQVRSPPAEKTPGGPRSAAAAARAGCVSPLHAAHMAYTTAMLRAWSIGVE
jgi:hypothetical protein